jgi:GNAT superfamily N-acetyltransferase
VIAVELLDPAAAEDGVLVERLTALINDVYASSETGLWLDGSTRTTRPQVAALVAAGEIAIAKVDGALAGAVRVQRLSDVTGELGMLAADQRHRGIGVGRELVRFAEGHCHAHGMRAMQLELLVPRTWRHPSKVFLDDWYRRIGYRVVRTMEVDDMEPELAPLLATPCRFLVYEKPLP